MDEIKNLHSEDNVYEEGIEFDIETWSRIFHYTNLKTEEDIRKYLYNLVAKKLMRGDVSREYVEGYLDCQKQRVRMKQLAIEKKPDLTEEK